MIRSSFNPVASVLKNLAQSYGFEVRLWEIRLEQEWDTIVGETIAFHTKPEKIRFRTLYVLVENSVWLQQLVFFQSAILENIQMAMEKPLIDKLVFRIGAWTKPSSKPDSSITQPSSFTPTQDILREARAATSCVHDEELRESLTILLSKALSRHAESFPSSTP